MEAHYTDQWVFHGGKAHTITASSRKTTLPYYLVDDGSTITDADLQKTLPRSFGREVIALTGGDRGGKTRTAIQLADKIEASSSKSTRILSFADPLRDICERLDTVVAYRLITGEAVGWQEALGEATEELEAILEDEEGRHGAPHVQGREYQRRLNDYLKSEYPLYRQAMINTAEAIKAHDPNFFVRLMLEEIDDAFAEDVDVVIIDDLRYENEFAYLKAMLRSFKVVHLHLDASLLHHRRDRWVKETNGVRWDVEEDRSDAEVVGDAAAIALALGLDSSEETKGSPESVAQANLDDILTTPTKHETSFSVKFTPSDTNAAHSLFYGTTADDTLEIDSLKSELKDLREAIGDLTEVVKGLRQPASSEASSTDYDTTPQHYSAMSLTDEQVETVRRAEGRRLYNVIHERLEELREASGVRSISNRTYRIVIEEELEEYPDLLNAVNSRAAELETYKVHVSTYAWDLILEEVLLGKDA